MGVLVRCAAAVTAVVAVLVLVAALWQGSEAALSALVGGVIGLVVMLFGTVSVNAVAGLTPALSLSVALLTYGLQVALTLLVLVSIERSGILEDALDRRWLGVSLILAVIAWMPSHVVGVMRARLQVYDLPDEARSGGSR